MIDGLQYDFKNFVHPGGNNLLQLFVSEAGDRDLSTSFISNHGRPFPHERYKHLCLSEPALKPKKRAYFDYNELIRLVKKAGIPSGPKTGYWGKVSLLLSANIYLTAVQYREWSLFRGIILGFVNALIGLNIQHDANHGSVSRDSRINAVLGNTQNLIGGSRRLWIIQHMVKHHVHTNNFSVDPDTDGREIIRLNSKAPLRYFHKYQWIYAFCGLGAYAYEILGTEMIECFRRGYIWDIFTKNVFIYLNIIAPIMEKPGPLRVLETQIPLMFTGGYLAFFFLLSHNYMGVGTRKPVTFMQKQVEESSNVCGRGLSALNGGLNYQIEHHLFPRYHHSRYPDLALVVRPACKKNGYRYTHFKKLLYNVRSTVWYLWTLGRY